MYPLFISPKELHIFKVDTSFDKVLRLYRFDKKLRLLLFNEIEKIEIAVRNSIVNSGCEMTGDSFWMTDINNFYNTSKFRRTLCMIDDELSHTREEFIFNFKSKYENPYPPAWILAEILPFGLMTNIYANIKDKKIKKHISQSFGLQPAPFESWLTIITLTRNLCCHHARIWNRQNTLRPTLPNRISLPWIKLPTDTLRTYFDICIIKYFMNVISPNNDMLDKMLSLFSSFPEIDLAALGFPKGDWRNEPLWRNNCPKTI